jgi:hypothetical protein
MTGHKSLSRRSIVKNGTRVITKYGPGEIVSREGDKGVLSHRYLVRLDNFDMVPSYLDFTGMQRKYGGLAFLDIELKTEGHKH